MVGLELSKFSSAVGALILLHQKHADQTNGEPKAQANAAHGKSIHDDTILAFRTIASSYDGSCDNSDDWLSPNNRLPLRRILWISRWVLWISRWVLRISRCRGSSLNRICVAHD